MGSLVLVELVLAASHTLEAGEVSLYSQQMEVAVHSFLECGFEDLK